MKILLALLLASVPAAAEGWLTDLASAKKAAAASAKPILVDFQAVWCYSCYYMEGKVLSREAFKKAAEGLVLLKLDVDTEEGGALKAAHRVGFLPSYLLLDAAGAEKGRIIGEQTEADFLAQLSRLMAGSAAGPAQRLAAALDANDIGGAERLRAALAKTAPPPSGPEWAKAAARLDLGLALKGKKAAEAVDAFEGLMKLGGGCELAYHYGRAEGPVLAAAPERRKAALTAARAALEPIVEARFFGPVQERCADQRSQAETLASVYQELGLAAERRAFLDRVADEYAKRSAAAGVGADRNLDDDLRFFLALADRREALEAHLKSLLDAYPSDYVYPFRYAKVLKEWGRAAEALAQSEKAYRLSYGANRFSAARLRADLLAGAGRGTEARDLLRLELKAAKAHFPDAAGPLEESLTKLGR